MSGLQRLNNQQHADGGWGWWVNEKSSVTTSIYVVFGLVKAQQAGFPVDQNVLDQGVAYLTKNILPATQIDTPWKANQQAYLLYVLADAGQPQTSALVSLYDGKRALLGNYGKALLALGLNRRSRMRKARRASIRLMSDIVSQAKASATGTHWEEQALYWGSWEHRYALDGHGAGCVCDSRSQECARAQHVVRWLMNVARGRPLALDAGDRVDVDRVSPTGWRRPANSRPIIRGREVERERCRHGHGHSGNVQQSTVITQADRRVERAR